MQHFIPHYPDVMKKTTYLLFLIATPLIANFTFITQSPMPPSNENQDAIPQEKIVLEHDGQEIAFLNYCSYQDYPHVAGIYSLYVIPEQRGHGYAQKLLQHALTYLKGKEYEVVLINAGPFELVNGISESIEDPAKKERLLGLYKKIGFLPTEDPDTLYYVFTESYSRIRIALISIASLLALATVILLVRKKNQH